MTKKSIILISLLMLLFAGIIWFNIGSEPPIKIIGDLPAHDLVEIKRVVRDEVRRELFPSFSLKGLKQFSTGIKRYSDFKFKNIEISSNGVVSVIVSVGKGPNSYECETYYKLHNGTTGWGIDSAVYWNWTPNRRFIKRSSLNGIVPVRSWQSRTN